MHTRNKWQKFGVRIVSSLFLAAIIIPAYFIEDGKYLSDVIWVGLITALIEYLSVTNKSLYIPVNCKELMVVIAVMLELTIVLMNLVTLHTQLVSGCIVVCVATDIGAYLSGNFLGGRIIKCRPFPKTSPNKSYEGLLFGTVCGVTAAIIWDKYILASYGISHSLVRLLIAVPGSIIGDYLESRFKRICGVKDSNDFLVEMPVFNWIEKPLGGRDGHGGYLDRLDSLTLVLSIQIFLCCLW